MGNYGGEPGSECPQKIAVWLETLLEGLELMIVRSSAELILVRTNIREAGGSNKKRFVRKVYNRYSNCTKNSCQTRAAG